MRIIGLAFYTYLADKDSRDERAILLCIIIDVFPIYGKFISALPEMHLKSRINFICINTHMSRWMW